MRKKFGLALSGGGYRAAAFHLGTFRALERLQLLNKVDVLSTISGGSITGAAYCLNKKDYATFEREMIQKLSTKNVIVYVLVSQEFLRTAFLTIAFIATSIYLSNSSYALFASAPIFLLFFLLILFQFRIFPVSRVIERAYDKFFYKNATLPELCNRPKIAIGSTNLQTSRPFTFSRDRMEDSYYKFGATPVRFVVDGFPVSRAVMASSCVPFAFTPISIGLRFFKEPRHYKLIRPRLVDGGVFDNQGIHKLNEEKSEYNCDIVLVSDAGNKLPFNKSYNNTFTLLLRTVNVFMQRIKNFQTVSNVYKNHHGKEIAYLSLPWELHRCLDGFVDNLADGNISYSLTTAHKLAPEWVESPEEYRYQIKETLQLNCNYEAIEARNLDCTRLKRIWKIGTNLTPLRETVILNMIDHADNLTELQLRLYCPSLFDHHE